MKKQTKIEITVLILLTFLNFFLIKKELSSLLYIFLFIPLGLYFFPIKPIMLIVKNERESLAYKIISCFIISLSIILAYISYLIGIKFTFIKIAYLIELIINLYLISYFVKNKDQLYILHIIIVLLNAMSYYVN